MSEATPPGNEPDTGAPATPATPAAPAAPASPATPPPDAKPPEGTPPPKEGDPKPPAPPAAKEGEPPPSDPAKPATPEFKLPDEWKDKPWAAKIKSQDDLFKQLDHLNAAVGKKVIVPDLEKATDVEREEYYKLTRPANGVEAYQFGDKAVDPIVKDTMGKSLLDNGVSAFQANNIIKDYQAAEGKLLAEAFNPDGFKQTMEATFGADWEKLTGHTKNMLTGLMSPEDNALMDNLPNVYAGLVYRTLSEVVKAYGINESFAHITAPKGAPPAANLETVRANLRGELGKLTSRPHTADEKASLIKQINDTYKDDPRIARKA